MNSPKLMKILLVLFAVSYNTEIYEWFNVSTKSITTSNILTIVMTLIFLKITIWDGRELKLAKNPAILFFVIFMMTTFVSGIYPLLSGNQPMLLQYCKTMLNFHFTMMIVILLILYKFENETWNQFIKVWLILSIGINVFGIYQIIARALDLPFAWINLTNASFFNRNQYETNEITQLSLRFEGFYRATSIFTEPSALGAFNSLTLIFLLVPKFLKYDSFIKSKFLYNTILLFSILGLLLAFSMTGVTIVIVMLFIIFIKEKLNTLVVVLKFLPFLIIFIIAADLVVQSYADISVLGMFGQRFSSLSVLLSGGGSYSGGIEGESIIMRGENFTSIFNIWQSSPVFGVGLGLTYLSPYADGWFFSDTSIMAIMAELGLVGAIPYVALFVAFYAISLKLTLVKSIYNSLDFYSRRLLSLIIYVMSFLVVINFISGNNLINISSAFFLGFIISITNNYYIDYAKNYYTIKFVDNPLRDRFIR